MPELPEVETTVRGLAPVLEGATIAAIETRRPDLRRPFPVDLRPRMTGARVTGLGRRAKYGLIDTDRGDTLIFHLGMSGRWRIDPSELLPHDHLLIDTGAGRRVALNDPRRFGSVDLWPSNALADFPAFAALGPEPLGPDLTGAGLHKALAGESSRDSATSMSARRCILRGSRRNAPRAICRAPSSTGWSRRSARFSPRRSRPAGRPCAIMPNPTANWAISLNNSRFTGAKEKPVLAAASWRAMQRAGGRRSGVQSASVVDRAGVPR